MLFVENYAYQYLPGKLLNRDLPGQQTMLLIGLGAKAGWKTDEHLSLLMGQRGKRPGEEFFLGNALLARK